MNNPTDNEVILQLVAELHLELEWWRSHAQLATKQDLDQMEARLTSEFNANSSAENAVKALEPLLERSQKMAAKLSALDAQTSPK